MSDTLPIKENRMGTQPINSLLISMSWPMILSMLAQALYNVVDSIFVSRVSENALTAVSMAFPMQSLMIAVGVGTGVGVNALLSKSLGEKDFERANKTADNGIFLGLCSMAVFMLLSLFAVRPFFASQTQTAEILEGGVSYLTIVMLFSGGLFMQLILEKLLASTGKTILTMVCQGVGAILNIILDPILIFGLLGAPRLGVAGAAIATVIGQWIAMGVGLWLNLRFNREIQISLRRFRPNGAIIKRIYAVGVPSIIMQAIGSLMTYAMNRILGGFSSTAVAVFGVYFKLQSFVFMPVFGLNNGMVPIVSYNYGARKPDRLMSAIRWSVVYGVGMMLCGLAVFQLFPSQLLRLFDASPDMLAMGVPALRIISLSYIFPGFCIIAGSAFQALGHGVLSMWVSITRQLLVLIPLAYLFSLSGQVSLVWLAFPCAEIASTVLSVIFSRRVYKQVVAPLYAESPAPIGEKVTE